MLSNEYQPILMPSDSEGTERPLATETGQDLANTRGRMLPAKLTRPGLLLGMAIVSLNLILIGAAPFLAPHDPEQPNPEDSLVPPSWEHPFGTDVTGMDVFSRVLYAPRVDLPIAIVASLAAFAIGGGLGVLAGYHGGWIGEGIGRISDTIQSFPAFVLALVIVAAAGQQISNVIYVIAFVTAPLYLRLLKAQTLIVRERAFIEAARCMGVSSWRILFRHVVPNALGPALAQLSVSIGGAILFTAGLSFIGAGVRVPTPEWGVMIAVGAKSMITGQWWPALFPALAMAITVLGFALVADGLQDHLDLSKR